MVEAFELKDGVYKNPYL